MVRMEGGGSRSLSSAPAPSLMSAPGSKEVVPSLCWPAEHRATPLETSMNFSSCLSLTSCHHGISLQGWQRRLLALDLGLSWLVSQSGGIAKGVQP